MNETVEIIKQRFPYPVELIEKIEELPVAVSEMENTIEEID